MLTTLRKQQSNILDRLYGFDFFISYAWDDGEEWAKLLKHSLENSRGRKLSVFFDQSDFQPGDELSSQTVRKIKSSEVVLLVLTRGAYESDWVAKEVQLALTNNKRVVPINMIKKDETYNRKSELYKLLHGDTNWQLLHIDIHDNSLDALKDGSSGSAALGSVVSSENKSIDNEILLRILGSLSAGRVTSRRQRVLQSTIAVLTILLLLSTALGIYSQLALKTATDQRNLAISSIRQLVYKTQEHLEDKPGLQALRHQLLSIAVDSLEKVENVLTDASDLTQRDEENAKARLVDLKIEAGRYEEAISDALLLSNKREKALQHAKHGNPVQLHDLLAANDRLSAIYLRVDKTDLALALDERNISVMQRLLKIENTVSNRIRLAETQVKVGGLYLRKFLPEKAFPLLIESVDALNTLFYQSPSNERVLLSLAHAQLLLGASYRDQGLMVEAGNQFAEGLSDVRLYIENEDLSVAGNIKGIELASEFAKIYLNINQPEDAGQFVEEALRYSDKLMSHDEASPDILESRLNALDVAAQFHISLGDWPQGLRYINEALMVVESLIQLSPGLNGLVLQKANFLVFKGEVLLYSKKYAEAINVFRSALSHVDVEGFLPFNYYIRSSCGAALAAKSLQDDKIQHEFLEKLFGNVTVTEITDKSRRFLPTYFLHCVDLRANQFLSRGQETSRRQLYHDAIELAIKIRTSRALTQMELDLLKYFNQVLTTE